MWSGVESVSISTSVGIVEILLCDAGDGFWPKSPIIWQLLSFVVNRDTIYRLWQPLVTGGGRQLIFARWPL
jgi:hypothetical protein